MKICVYGSADNFPENVTKEARKLGELIGKSGHTLTYGGFGDGLMVEVANGVSDTKGKILAVTPIAPRKGHPLHSNIDEILSSDDKRERKRMQADNADLFIVLPTGIGVMDELFEILVLKSYGQIDKDILILNIDGYYDTLKNLLKEQNALSLCEFMNSVDEIEKYM